MRSVQLFYNDNKEYIGFAANVKMKNKEIYIDTRTGTGFKEVIESFQDFIAYYASKYNFDGFDTQDNKQHITMRVLESIFRFNPTKNVKLSTFLQMSVSRRLINEIRDNNRFMKNATNLNIQLFSYKCDCGHSITGDNTVKECVCGKLIDAKKKHWIRQTTVSYDSNCDGYCSPFEESEAYSKLNTSDLENYLLELDNSTRDIIHLIYYEDCPIKMIAEKLNMSQANIYAKLKSLKKNQKLYNIIRGPADEK